MPNQISCRHQGDAGFALAVVLWIALALALLAAGIAQITRSNFELALSAAARPQARAAADAGVARAILALLGETKSPVWRLDGTPQRWLFDGITVDIAIKDEFGKIDINVASDEILRNFFRQEGLSEQDAETLSDTIADWRSPAGLKRLNGATNDDYRRAGYPYDPRNGPFESVDELGQVMGMSEDLLDRLRPDLTVYSRRPIRRDERTRRCPCCPSWHRAPRGESRSLGPRRWRDADLSGPCPAPRNHRRARRPDRTRLHHPRALSDEGRNECRSKRHHSLYGASAWPVLDARFRAVNLRCGK